MRRYVAMRRWARNIAFYFSRRRKKPPSAVGLSIRTENHGFQIISQTIVEILAGDFYTAAMFQIYEASSMMRSWQKHSSFAYYFLADRVYEKK